MCLFVLDLLLRIPKFSQVETATYFDGAPDPSMSREEALKNIRQRRGRVRSVAAGNVTPRRQMVKCAGIRRDTSAPAGTFQSDNGKKDRWR